MADTNTLGQVPESNNIDSLYTEVDNTLSLVHEVPSTITETSIHNTTSVNLGADRENDDSLKINKDEKVSLRGLEDKKNTYAPTANLDVAHFADKRFISKQLSDKNDTVIMADLDKEIIRSYETDVILANALNLEDEEREIADAQLRADIAKEALERANADSNLAEIIEKYKYAMSQHITTRELDVNGDTRLNIEVVDGDTHGGNLDVETSLVVGSKNAENGTTTSEGKVIGDAHIKHDLFVDNDTTIGNDLLVENDSHIMNDLLVDQNATIEGNLDVNGTTTLNELEVENNLSVGGNLKVKGDTDLDKTLNVDGAVTLNDTLTVEKDTTLKDDLVVNKTATVDGATQLNDTLTVEKATTLSDTLTVEKATQLNNTLTAEGATTLKDVLNVKKSTTLEDVLTVDKSTQLNDTLTVDNSTQLNDTLTVEKATQLDDTLDVKKATTLEDTLNVKKGALLEDTLQVNKRTDIGTDQTSADLYVHGSEYISNNLNVTETSNLGTTNIGTTESNKNLTVNGNELISGTLDVNGKTTINNELEVLNATVLKSTLNVNGNTDLDGTLNVDGATSLKSTLNVTGKSTLGTLSAGTTDLGTTTVGTSSNKKNLTVNGNESVSGTLNVTGKSTLGEVSAGTTTIGTSSANKNLTVNGNETITGNLNVNTNTDLDGTLNVDGETTLNANVKIKDDSNTQKSFSDIIGTIKNALVKDFTQSYNSTTGQLTSTLTFNNLYSGNTNRPTVSTITKTINLDLEKYILDINDVYATKTISNGKTTYTDFDISTLTDEEIRDLDSPDYTGNIIRCLKVKYNTYNNTNAGTEKSYVYFEINDIFKSIISKLELEINNEITARNNAITNAINNLDVASVGSNGGYIKTISETNGKISAARQPFDTSISSSSTANNAPTSKAVYDFIGTLDVAAVGQDGSYLKTISETNGKIAATAQSFDTAINADSTDNNVPTSKAVKTYVSQEINNLDVASVGSIGGYIYTISETNGKIAATRQSFATSVASDSVNAPNSRAVYEFVGQQIGSLDVAALGKAGSYIQVVSETNGKIAATVQAFDTSISSTSTANNAPTSKAVYDFIGTLDVASVGSDGGYIKTISETNGKISAARQAFDTSISSTSTNAPTSKAVYDFIGTLDVATVGSDGGYIKTISETNGKISATRQAFDTTVSSTSTNAPTSKAICDYLKSHEKTITLKDAAGNTLLSFVCYAPDATAYSPALGTITLNTTTVI